MKGCKFLQFLFVYSRLKGKIKIFHAMSALHNLADEYKLPIIAINAIAKQGSETLTMFSGAEAARIAYGIVTEWGLTDETKNLDATYNTVKLELFKNRYGKRNIKHYPFPAEDFCLH